MTDQEEHDGTRQAPGAVSVTIIKMRRWLDVGLAVRKYRGLVKALASKGYQLDALAVARWRSREVVFVTMARSQEELRRAAAEPAHIAAVRWVIPRRVKIWSGVFALQGWSSMSGPPDGVWSDRAARRLSGVPTPPPAAGGHAPGRASTT
jgi:hypothetical protein